jgi:hypothetical protein
MRLIACFTLLSLTVGSAVAQDTWPSELASANERLNSIYQRVLDRMAPDEQAKLRKAQQAWIAYRDLDCESFIGTGSPMDFGKRLFQVACIATTMYMHSPSTLPMVQSGSCTSRSVHGSIVTGVPSYAHESEDAYDSFDPHRASCRCLVLLCSGIIHKNFCQTHCGGQNQALLTCQVAEFKRQHPQRHTRRKHKRR